MGAARKTPHPCQTELSGDYSLSAMASGRDPAGATQLVVCLGATAAQALLGRTFRVTQQRGVLLDAPFAKKAMATVHPSSILRAPDENTRRDRNRYDLSQI